MLNLLPFSPSEFEAFCKPLIGLLVSRLWRGYGSAIFLELGDLKPWKYRRDGSLAEQGEWTLSITGGWRIEGKRLIWCGSWSDEERWSRGLGPLTSTSIQDISLVGRLPELDVAFVNGMHLVSMMSAELNPEWALTHNRDDLHKTVYVRSGRLVLEESSILPIAKPEANA